MVKKRINTNKIAIVYIYKITKKNYKRKKKTFT